MGKVDVKGIEISYYSHSDNDFICLTDIAKYKNPNHSDDLMRNCLRNRNTIEFLGIWEQLYNHNFNPVEFDGIKIQELSGSSQNRVGTVALLPIKILLLNLAGIFVEI